MYCKVFIDFLSLSQKIMTKQRAHIISYNNTLDFGEIAFCIEPETSVAITTEVSKPKPLMFIALTITASSNASKIDEMYFESMFFNSLYADKNLNGNCFEFLTAFSSDK